MAKHDVKISTLISYFDDAEDATVDARGVSERCRDYYDGKQLTSEEINTLKKRKQPVIVFNMVQPKVDFLLGYEKQSRTDPKAYPRTPDHDDAAAAATDGIRYALDVNDFDHVASSVFENMVIEGTGGVAVEVENGKKGIDIKIKNLEWNRIFVDPYSMDKQCRDARYIGYVSWKDADVVYARWPDSKDALSHEMAQYSDSFSEGDTKDDKPTRWMSPKRKRIMCVDICFMHAGEWWCCIYAKGAFLVKPKPSVYLDADGVPQNKFLVASAYVDRDGNRYGPTKNDLDRQDEVNKRRSKATHIINTRQTFSKTGQIDDIDKFKSEANKPDGHLSFPGSGTWMKDFGIIPNESLAGPQFEMYLEAKASMDMGAASAALLQGTGEGMSGRAIRSLQQGVMVELTPLYDILAHFKMRVYRATWDRIKQFWKEDKWIRVTDDEETLKWVGLNEKMTVAEKMAVEQSGLDLQTVRQQHGQELQQLYAQNPQMAQEYIGNEVAEMDVDIILEDVPDVINLQSEQFEIISQMYMSNPFSAENPEGMKWEHVIEMSTLRNKKKYLGKDPTPEEQQQAQQAQQEAQERKQVEQFFMQLDAQAKQGQMQLDQVTAQEKLSKAQASDAKTFQTKVETAILMRNPDPDPQTII